MPKQYAAFYDRSPATINGALTIQEYNPATRGVKKLINKIPARSGQGSYVNHSWVRGKSPIPYNVEVEGQRLYLWLRPRLKEGTILAPARGIGEFWPISSSPAGERVIEAAETGQIREDIGLHDENYFEGSAGCIVIVSDKDFLALHAVLHELKNEGVVYLPLTVL